MTKDLDDRLLRLKESYKKLPTQSDPKQLVKLLLNVEKESKKGRRKLKLPVPAIVFVTFIFLGTVSTTWILNNPTTETTLPNSETKQFDMDEEKHLELVGWAEDITERFEGAVIRNTEELGLTKEQFETLQFVQDGYSILELTVELIERKELPYENIRTEEWEERIMDSIRSPHELLQILTKGEKLSLEEEQAFLYEYGDKVKQLSLLYNELFVTNTLHVNPQLLKEQGFVLSTNKKGTVYQYEYDEFTSVLSDKLSPSALSYFESLSKQPYYYAGDFLYSEIEMVDSLVKLEPLLTNEDYDQFQDYELLQLYYQGGMFKLLTGTETYKIKENNTYSPTFITVLNELIEQNSAVSELAKTILQEIQNNNHSVTLQNLTYDQIWMEVLKKKHDDIEMKVK